MELLVKDVLLELEKASDVSKRISEVRASKPMEASRAAGEIRAGDYFNDAFRYALRVQMERQQYEELARMQQSQQQAMQLQRGLLGQSLGQGFGIISSNTSGY